MEQNQQPIQTKICPVCGAKNKSAYRYCNECGAAFAVSNQSYTPFVGNYPTNAASTATIAPDLNTSIDGVAATDLFDYTGKKPELYNKMLRNRLYPSNRAFCVPLLILGLLLGFFGMACWYIYHKMYKPAVLFLCFTAIFLLSYLISYYDVMQSIAVWYGDIFKQAQSGMLLNGMTEAEFLSSIYSSLFESLNQPSGPIATIAGLITNATTVAQIVLAIVLPFHAYNQYLNTALKRIRTAYKKSDSPNITKLGGTNKGMLALIIVLYAIAIIIVFSILLAPLVETFMNFFKELGPALDGSFTTY